MRWTDEQMEGAMGVLLRSGVILAAAVVVAGGARYFAVHGNEPLDFTTFRGEPAELRGPIGVIRGLAAGHGRNLIQLGLLLLIATPIARVVFAVAAFAVEKDRTYVVVSLIVLGMLLYGLAGH